MRCCDAFCATPACELLKTLLAIRGSVIPRSLFFALPCGLYALGLKYLQDEGHISTVDVLANNAAFTGFTFAITFLLVFRTSQAYSRYWEGITVGHRMLAEWFDFASSVIAFSKYSKAEPEVTQAFHHRLVRLLSLLHAGALASLRGIDGSNFELIDINGLDQEDVDAALVCDHAASLIGQWILELVVEGIELKILTAPPPIVSRAFQEFANGMVAYHDAMKIQTTKFPFPYSQMSAVMLIAHWFITPWVMCQWIRSPGFLFTMTLLQVLVFWSLYFTAVEIEYPFKQSELSESHPASWIQREFNQQLLMIISPSTRCIPALSVDANLDVHVLSLEHVEHFIGDTSGGDMSKTKATQKKKRSSFLNLHSKVLNVRQARASRCARATIEANRDLEQGRSSTGTKDSDVSNARTGGSTLSIAQSTSAEPIAQSIVKAESQKSQDLIKIPSTPSNQRLRFATGDQVGYIDPSASTVLAAVGTTPTGRSDQLPMTPSASHSMMVSSMASRTNSGFTLARAASDESAALQGSGADGGDMQMVPKAAPSLTEQTI